VTAFEDLLPERNDTVRALTRRLDVHSPGERDHSARVATYAVATGHHLGWSLHELVELRWAAELHDIGKVSLDAGLLRKLSELTDQDMALLRLHAELALGLLEEYDWLGNSLPMIRHHHEWWNGLGYPDGLVGNQIPLGARIIAAAEAFDVISFGAGWKAAQDPALARAELRQGAGTQFDPQVVDALLRVQPLIQPM
jgi:HD-GYP domain-containing protein (c-di-GMP phosphodiesterase class II)